MVECECISSFCCVYFVVVLIDTWWNVNTFRIVNRDIVSKVLIDTWWNVNKVRAKVFEEGKAVLIDTWWNVNACTIRIVVTT